MFRVVLAADSILDKMGLDDLGDQRLLHSAEMATVRTGKCEQL